MNVEEWLDLVAIKKHLSIDDPDNHSFEDDRKSYDIYVSKFDGSYITSPETIYNDYDDYIIKQLAKHEVIEELTHGVGFSPKENKWYGWTHRGICGFTIGSECKKGDCHYFPKNKDDFLEQTIEFWKEDCRENLNAIHTTDANGDKGVLITWVYDNTIPNKKLQNRICSLFTQYPKQFGRGEWVAETMEDAKQMAIDYNRSIS